MPVGGEKSSNFDDINKIEKAEDGEDWKVGYSNSGYQNEKPPLASTSSANPSEQSSEHSDQPPPYEESAIVPAVSEKDNEIEVIEDDEKILNMLREIVRKCTLANPMKRPTAKEVLKMIEEVAPSELLSEKFNISDDEDDIEDSAEKKLK
ncbi:uncharacterized protein LOC132752979 isoform X2 [Ruditapes philippinarum]|uniref:uncharacterized protein LOC132752979 isoform X2 n=1 Tax=Ruditapes philippinarum TaxID=129788 RepID=UPI00295B743B|nr:uncharacterized protein LOC132752979 isoform X2 [Ruditapes philippinarum]